MRFSQNYHFGYKALLFYCDNLSWTNFFWYKPLLLLSSTCYPFSLCKIYKKFLLQIQSYKDVPFLGKMVHLPQTTFFLRTINITFIYLLTPFIVQNFKKIPPADLGLWGCAIFGPKITHLPKWEFFQKNC